jgi:hypothetical protein
LPARRENGTHTVPTNCTLVLYTDGLIERRAGSIDEGLAALAATLGPDSTGDPSATCETILNQSSAPSSRPTTSRSWSCTPPGEPTPTSSSPTHPTSSLTDIEGALLLEPAI